MGGGLYVVAKLMATKVTCLNPFAFLAVELWKDDACVAAIPNSAQVSEYTNQTCD
jgi:hypothetical protein